MRSFESELIPGLLQTEHYARRLHEVASHLAKPEDIDKRVAARTHRQARLTDDEAPLDFAAIVSEAAFRRTLGHTEIGPPQLAHVIELAQRPNVTVHVLPYAAGLHPSMSGSFTVLTFDTGVAQPVGYQEYAVGGHVVEDGDAVRRFVDLWDLLRDQAESLRWLSELS